MLSVLHRKTAVAFRFTSMRQKTHHHAVGPAPGERLERLSNRPDQRAIPPVRPEHAAERRRLAEVRKSGLRLVVQLSRQKILSREF